jgi:hypothetical protein
MASPLPQRAKSRAQSSMVPQLQYKSYLLYCNLNYSGRRQFSLFSGGDSTPFFLECFGVSVSGIRCRLTGGLKKPCDTRSTHDRSRLADLLLTAGTPGRCWRWLGWLAQRSIGSGSRSSSVVRSWPTLSVFPSRKRRYWKALESHTDNMPSGPNDWFPAFLGDH